MVALALLLCVCLSPAPALALALPLLRASASAILALTLAPHPILPYPTLPYPTLPTLLVAKEELPALDRCFGAVRRELGVEGESLARLERDIASGDFKDVIAFTREYDAGFRGGVLKTAWKQLGAQKGRGIELSNSFTFDLIALNKAARVRDTDEARRCLGLVRQDLVDFLALEKLVQ